jgi:hypothetical protein
MELFSEYRLCKERDKNKSSWMRVDETGFLSIKSN